MQTYQGVRAKVSELRGRQKRPVGPRERTERGTQDEPLTLYPVDTEIPNPTRLTQASQPHTIGPC